MLKRIFITLYPDERDALIALAQQERRDPREQAAVLIRKELERTGRLLKAPEVQCEPA